MPCIELALEFVGQGHTPLQPWEGGQAIGLRRFLQAGRRPKVILACLPLR